MRYTAVFQTSEGELRAHIGDAPNDRTDAWKRFCQMKEGENECLILLVPGSHPVVRYENIATTESEQIDLFSNY